MLIVSILEYSFVALSLCLLQNPYHPDTRCHSLGGPSMYRVLLLKRRFFGAPGTIVHATGIICSVLRIRDSAGTSTRGGVVINEETDNKCGLVIHQQITSPPVIKWCIGIPEDTLCFKFLNSYVKKIRFETAIEFFFFNCQNI